MLQFNWPTERFTMRFDQLEHGKFRLKRRCSLDRQYLATLLGLDVPSVLYIELPQRLSIALQCEERTKWI